MGCGQDSNALQQVTFVRHDGYFAEYVGDEDEVSGLASGYMSVEAAKSLCKSRSKCEGFTFKGDEFAGDVFVFFKSVRRIHNDCWTSFIKQDDGGFDIANGYINDEDGDHDDIGKPVRQNLETAKQFCTNSSDCKGFTFVGSTDGTFVGKYLVYHKSQINPIYDDCHTAYRKEYL